MNKEIDVKDLILNLLQRVEVLERQVHRIGNLPDTNCERCGAYLADVDGIHRRDSHGYHVKLEGKELQCQFCGKTIAEWETFKHWGGLCEAGG